MTCFPNYSDSFLHRSYSHEHARGRVLRGERKKNKNRLDHIIPSNLYRKKETLTTTRKKIYRYGLRVRIERKNEKII